MSSGGIQQFDLPPIYVSHADYDDMGAILDRLNVPYSNVGSVDLSRRREGIVMLNCSTKSVRDEVDLDALAEFVRDGGVLIASDLMGSAVAHFTNARFEPRSWGAAVQASIDDPELREILGRQSIELDFDTAIREVTTLPAGAEPLLSVQDSDTVIAYRHSCASGEVIYTTFHNHSQNSEIEDALLEVLLMVPVAAATNTTVTETYTTIVGDNGGDTAVQAESGDAVGENPTGVYESPNETTVELSPSGTGEGGVTVRLTPGESVRLGRGDLDGVASDEDVPYISGTHLEITAPADGLSEYVEVVDCDSTNGTRVDGSSLVSGSSTRLTSGSEVTLADRVTLVTRID